MTTREYYLAHKEEIAKQHKEYYEKNKEKYRETALRWYYEHLEKAKERMLANQKNGKQKIYSRRYYEKKHGKKNKLTPEKARENYLAGRKFYYQEHRKEFIERSTNYRKNIGKFRKYGITKDEYDLFVRNQDGRCAICGKPFGEKIAPCIDHDHKNNTVRGLLCKLCNASLGGFYDDVNILEKAINYLKEPK